MNTNNSDKKILQFWSGGADSTYLLLQNLMAKHKLTVTYVDIRNNRTKSDREEKARQLLKDDIARFCDYFDCPLPTYLDGSHIRISGETFSRCNAPQQIIFAMYSMLLGNGFDEVQMGVVLGDSMCGVPLNEKFVEVYREVLSDYFPDITYPIEDVSKEAIYLTLQGYDNLIGTHFIKHLTCCESVDKPCGKRKACLPCKTQEEVFRRLRWIP